MPADKLPGCLFQRNERWFWMVKLPGGDKRRQYPMVPPGGEFATHDRGAAVDLAWEMYRAALRKQAGDGEWDGTLGCLVEMYRKFAAKTFRHQDGSLTSHYPNIVYATDPLVERYPQMRAEEFGPLKLDEIRNVWVSQDPPPCRSTINMRTKMVRAMFKWALAREMIPASQYVALSALPGLHKNRSRATEPRKVRAVKPDLVVKTMEQMPATVKAMVEVHMLTGMRSSELCWMRPCDIDRKGEVWIYNVPAEANKNEHREGDEHSRHVPLVARVREIIKPLLEKRGDKEFLFQPAQADAETRAIKRKARKTPVWPSHQARYDREKAKAEHRAFHPQYVSAAA